jgi:hypothetical protein
VRIDRILVEIVFSVEVSPYCERKNHRFLNPIKEAVAYIASFNVRVQAKETAKSNAPFDRGEGVGVSKDVFSLQIIHLGDLQPVILLTHYNV